MGANIVSHFEIFENFLNSKFEIKGANIVSHFEIFESFLNLEFGITTFSAPRKANCVFGVFFIFVLEATNELQCYCRQEL